MKHIHLDRPLAFFDLETTGIDPVNDRILEIAVVKVMPDGSRKTLEQRLNPEMPIPASATEVHGISDEDVKDAPKFKDIANDLFAMMSDCDIAGYNSNRFDLPMLTEEFYRVGKEIDFKERKLIDVQQIFFRKEERSLSAAYNFYCDKCLDNAHSALADVNATIDILDAQIGKYEDIGNSVNTLHNFSGGSEIVDFANRIIMKDGTAMFNFGKYKGKPVFEVFEKEPQYYNWMMKSDFPRDTKNAITHLYNEMKLAKFKKS